MSDQMAQETKLELLFEMIIRSKFDRAIPSDDQLQLLESNPYNLDLSLNNSVGNKEKVPLQNDFPCIESKHIYETFGNLNGRGIIVDDILVSGKDEGHDENLKEVLQKAREVGVKFNLDKCIFGSTNVPYFGHLITTDGIEPDPSKAQAIREMPQPSNKDKLATLLGMTNFLFKYIPNLSFLSYLLQELRKQNVFEWTSEPTEAMEQIKTLTCSNLATFDIKANYEVPPVCLWEENQCTYRSQAVQGYIILQLHPYNITIQYVREKDLPVADTLSRLYPPHIDEGCSLDIEFHVHSVAKSIRVSNKKMGIIHEENQRPGYDRTYINEFQIFLKKWDIQLVTSSLNFPQSNSHVEKAVGIVCRIMQKAIKSNTDLYLGVLEYQNTPIDGITSLAQLLMSRSIRSILPYMLQQLQPKILQKTKFCTARNQYQEAQKQNCDKDCNDLTTTSPSGLSKEDARWTKGIVMSCVAQGPILFRLKMVDSIGGIWSI
ncbi:hypothetical protein QYM36_007431 [Artemia franciscana]|uniref:Uncharacterized protein n=1 Tax=Artemia franciscana TaxID=6661 RepID=A0AA88IG40_ARTSF|nr:hypothetical protein QYM36_007431 [Artemia franciscana]